MPDGSGRRIARENGRERRESVRSAAIGRERLDRLVDDLRQAVPEGLAELAGLAAGEQQALVGTLRQHRDDRPEVGLEQAGQVFELVGQFQPSATALSLLQVAIRTLLGRGETGCTAPPGPVKANPPSGPQSSTYSTLRRSVRRPDLLDDRKPDSDATRTPSSHAIAAPSHVLSLGDRGRKR